MARLFRLRLSMLLFYPRGQGLAEYALIILLVGLIVIMLVTLFGQSVGNLFSNIIANF